MKTFHSMVEFSVYLGTLIPAVLVAQHEALVESCEVLQTEAKDMIGEYQYGAGGFIDWADLAPSTKAQRVMLGFTEDDPGLRTGEMRDSIQYRAGIIEAEVGSDDDKLVWFEEGTSKQPPRSVLGLAATRMGPKVAEICGEAVYLRLVGAKRRHGIGVKMPGFGTYP